MPHKRIIVSPRPDFRCRRVAVVFFCLLFCHAAFADITPDGTLGSNVSQVGVDFTITGGTERGANLFHSFSLFDINTGETASFQGPASIANILSRVTGGFTSNIDGILRSEIPGAAFYLINPAGVIFGPNATLDVQGAFHVSTADYIVLGNDGRFDVSDPANSVLTTAPPSAFGFLDNAPASLEFNGGFLRVPDGETLSVIGGDITINDATLYASEGRINLASVASAGEVRPEVAGLDTSDFAELGNIEVTHSTDIFGRPSDGIFFLANIDASGEGGGVIYIRGGRFVSDNGSVFSDTQGSGSKGTIDIGIRDELRLDYEGRITADTLFGVGNGGDIFIRAGSIVLLRGGRISGTTFRSGNGGNIDIDTAGLFSATGKSPADDPRLIGNQQSGIRNNAFGNGAGGTISIRAGSIALSDEAVVSVSTFGAGDAGNVTIDTDQLSISGGAALVSNSELGSDGAGGTVNIRADSIALSDEAVVSVSTFGAGDAGNVTIDTDQLSISGGAALVSNSRGAGDGGNIIVNATGAVTVSGAAPQDEPTDPSTESGIASNAFAEGDGGRIIINASEVRVEDRAVIQANLESNPIDGQPPPGADTRAGEISIQAGTLVLTGGGQVTSANLTEGKGGNIIANIKDMTQISGSSPDGNQTSGLFSITTGAGPAGSVELKTSDLQMADLGTVNTSTIGSGQAGNILIEADNVSLNSGARISSSTGGTGAGGQVTVKVSEVINVTGLGSDGFGSGFYSDVQVPANGQPSDASGNGGDINLTARNLTLSEQGTVSAKSDGAGDAGTISIVATNNVQLLEGSAITTESINSGGGKINIHAGGELLYLLKSRITSSVADGSGNGGDITIDPVFVVLNRSQIIAQAFAGAGGNINISTDFFITSADSIVDASSQLGVDGQVIITAANTDLSSSLVELPIAYQDATSLLQERCAARTAESTGSLVVTGPGGVPSAPGDLLYASPSLPTTLRSREVYTRADDIKSGIPVVVGASIAGAPALILGCGR